MRSVERYVLKTMHVDDDWIARSLGDVGCRPVRVWAGGLLDALPRRHRPHRGRARPPGWAATAGARALLMRDVGDHLVARAATRRCPPRQHAAFLDHMAELSRPVLGLDRHRRA